MQLPALLSWEDEREAAPGAVRKLTERVELHCEQCQKPGECLPLLSPFLKILQVSPSCLRGCHCVVLSEACKVSGEVSTQASHICCILPFGARDAWKFPSLQMNLLLKCSGRKRYSVGCKQSVHSSIGVQNSHWEKKRRDIIGKNLLQNPLFLLP